MDSFIESLHLYCANLSKFPGTGSMSITIGCILVSSPIVLAPLKQSDSQYLEKVLQLLNTLHKRKYAAQTLILVFQPSSMPNQI